jgi:hypothetical protein
MADIRTFAPGYGTGIEFATSTTSTNQALRPGSQQVVVTNIDATNRVYFRTTAADTGTEGTATNADYCVLPGQQVSITRAQDHGRIAVVAAAGTPSVHVITGDGI